MSKTDAFLWVLQLELPTQGESSRTEILRRYCHQVISITSDQGTEFGFGSLPELKGDEHIADVAAVLETKPQQSHLCLEEDKYQPLEIQDQVEQLDPALQEVALNRRMSQEQQLEEQRPEGQRQLLQFANALHVAGLRHVADNLLKSVLGAMNLWEPLLVQLRGLEKLLSRVQYRERLAAVCMPENDPQTSLVQGFSSKLGGLRWEVVVEFCIELLDIEEHLRKHWDIGAFLQGASGHGRWTICADFADADKAIRSDLFWGRVGVVAQIAFESEFIGRWASGCECHDKSHEDNIHREKKRWSRLPDSQIVCPRKGCRAPELACGQGLQSQLRVMSQQVGTIQSHFARVGNGSSAQDALLADWSTARSRLFGCWVLL